MKAIEEFFEHEKEAARSREQKDLQAWEEWNQQDRTPDAVRPLLSRFKPLIMKRANVYAGKNPNVPAEAVRAEFTNHAMKAFETYDPNRGAALKTHVYNQMRKGQRFISQYAGGFGRMPEDRFYQVQTFRNARDELSDQLQREPTALELSDKLQWPVKKVTQMTLEDRREVPMSHLAADMTSIKPSDAAETIRLIQYELSPEQQLVMEHLLGINGKLKLRPGQIATQLNISPSKVSRIRATIAKKIKQYEG
jgi:DNA-directed RNA polymerase specialized sigma subunit